MTQLEISSFLSIVKYDSISTAAEKLFVTQPALSRRLNALEKELGCRLVERQRGKKAISLTPQGKAFVPIAERYLALWGEANAIKTSAQMPVFTVVLNTSMGAHVPLAIQDFLSQINNVRVKLHVYHSLEAYQWMEYGMADLALVSKSLSNATITTLPAYKERFCLLARGVYQDMETIHPKQLDLSKELFVPWSPNFSDWHDYWFGTLTTPKAFCDNPPIMKYFWADEPQWWSIVPASFAQELLEEPSVRKIELLEGPEDLILYYLVAAGGSSYLSSVFLEALIKRAHEIPGITPYI